jgi:hypothetical protein
MAVNLMEDPKIAAFVMKEAAKAAKAAEAARKLELKRVLGLVAEQAIENRNMTDKIARAHFAGVLKELSAAIKAGANPEA